MMIKIDYSFYIECRKNFQIQNNPNHSSRFFCKECKEILIRPYQTKCGSRYCLNCIDKWINDCQKLCPSCEQVIPCFIKNCNPDKAMEKEIMRLDIKCINTECQEIVKLKDLKSHLEMCEYREEKCSKCYELYLYKNKKYHLSEKCQKTMIKCESCAIEMMRQDMETSHRNINAEDLSGLCEKWQRKCPRECSNKIFDNIKHHLQICPKRPVTCFMRDIGCMKVLNKDQMNDHMKDDEVYHFSLLANILSRTRSESKEVESQFTENKRYFMSNIEEISRSRLESMKQIESVTKRVLQVKEKVVKITEEIQEIKNHPNHKAICPSSITANNGEYSWTIPDIIQKIQDAKHGYTNQIVSEAFYTNIPGYKMRLKMYPNGDGVAKDKFLSLFFVIMKGQYDDVMSWPFKNKLTLSVVKTDTVIDSTKVMMTPNLNSYCYGKPVEEFNVGAGQPEFIRIENLNNYLNKGSFTVRLNVQI